MKLNILVSCFRNILFSNNNSLTLKKYIWFTLSREVIDLCFIIIQTNGNDMPIGLMDLCNIDNCRIMNLSIIIVKQTQLSNTYQISYQIRPWSLFKNYVHVSLHRKMWQLTHLLIREKGQWYKTEWWLEGSSVDTSVKMSNAVSIAFKVRYSWLNNLFCLFENTTMIFEWVSHIVGYHNPHVSLWYFR